MTKYHAKKTELDGLTFDSIAESRRYVELKLAVENGLIYELKIHPRYPIVVDGQKICTYIGDFEYKTYGFGTIVEDVKSSQTRRLPVYRLKRKLMLIVNKIEVLEVMA